MASAGKLSDIAKGSCDRLRKLYGKRVDDLVEEKIKDKLIKTRAKANGHNKPADPCRDPSGTDGGNRDLLRLERQSSGRKECSSKGTIEPVHPDDAGGSAETDTVRTG